MAEIISRLTQILAVILMFSMSFSASTTSQTADQPLYLNDDGLPTLAPLLAEVTPDVVNISVESSRSVEMNPLFNDPFFRRFFDMQPLPQQLQRRALCSLIRQSERLDLNSATSALRGKT